MKVKFDESSINVFYNSPKCDDFQEQFASLKPNSIGIAYKHLDVFGPLNHELFQLNTPILLLDHKDNLTARIATNCEFLDVRIVA